MPCVFHFHCLFQYISLSICQSISCWIVRVSVNTFPCVYELYFQLEKHKVLLLTNQYNGGSLLNRIINMIICQR